MPTEHSVENKKNELPMLNFSVWLLDNDPTILEAMQATLSDWRCKVLAAHSPKQLEKIANKETAPDLFLVDLDLGTDKDGFNIIAHYLQKFSRHRSCIDYG